MIWRERKEEVGGDLIEEQDTHHYSTTWYFIKSPSQVKSADGILETNWVRKSKRV